MKTKLKGNVRYFQYKGDILKEMQKCEKELEKIKSVSSQISERMEHGLYALQQNRQPKQTERSNYER